MLDTHAMTPPPVYRFENIDVHSKAFLSDTQRAHMNKAYTLFNRSFREAHGDFETQESFMTLANAPKVRNESSLHMVLAWDDKNPACPELIGANCGLLHGDYNTGLIIYEAVDPKSSGKGIALKMRKNLQRSMQQQAAHIQQQSSPITMFIELTDLSHDAFFKAQYNVGVRQIEIHDYKDALNHSGWRLNIIDSDRAPNPKYINSQVLFNTLKANREIGLGKLFSPAEEATDPVMQSYASIAKNAQLLTHATPMRYQALFGNKTEKFPSCPDRL